MSGDELVDGCMDKSQVDRWILSDTVDLLSDWHPAAGLAAPADP